VKDDDDQQHNNANDDDVESKSLNELFVVSS